MSFGARRCTALAALARLPIETHAPVKKQGSVRERKYVPLPCHGSIKPSCSGKKYVVVAMRHGIPAHPHGSRSRGPSLCNKGRGVSQSFVSPHWSLEAEAADIWCEISIDRCSEVLSHATQARERPDNSWLDDMVSGARSSIHLTRWDSGFVPEGVPKSAKGKVPHTGAQSMRTPG